MASFLESKTCGVLNKVVEMVPYKNRREHILSESAMLFKERGFGSATMRDIAVRVGIEAGSMYNHIKSKGELLEAICFRVAQIYLTQLDEIEAGEGSVAEKVEALIRLHVKIMVEDGASVYVCNNEWKSMGGEKLVAFKKMRSTYETRVKDLLRQGMETGVFRNVDPEIALFTLLSSVRWVERWYRPSRAIKPEALENDIVKLVIGGLKHG